MKKVYQILLLLALSTWAVIAVADKVTNYVIYIDAGSTDTRLHVYRYIYDSLVRNSIPQIDDIHTVSAKKLKLTSTTLASFDGQTVMVGDNLLKGLLDEAQQYLKTIIADDAQQKIYIYLFGTAGMRLIPPLRQMPIYDAAKQYVIKNYGYSKSHPGFTFAVMDKPNFENLDPKLEALYGWLDVNYLMGNFEKQSTSGSIDMGGASLEIAYALPNVAPSTASSTPANVPLSAVVIPPDTTDEIKDDNVGVYPLHIGGKDYKIIAASIDGLGHEESRRSIISNASPNYMYCFPPGSNSAVVGTSTSTVYSGSFNLSNCKMAYDAVINANKTLNIIDANIKNEKSSFVAYSGIYKAYRSIAGPLQSMAPDNLAMDSAIQSKCAASLPADSSRTTYCPNAVYISQLLYDKLDLNGRILITKTLQKDNTIPQQIAWTLGAVLKGLI